MWEWWPIDAFVVIEELTLTHSLTLPGDLMTPQMLPLIRFNGTPWVVFALAVLTVILGTWSRLKRMRKEE